MKKIAFVTAGGFGDRMHKDTPKQFLELQGIPVIIRTLLRFEQSSDMLLLKVESIVRSPFQMVLSTSCRKVMVLMI